MYGWQGNLYRLTRLDHKCGLDGLDQQAGPAGKGRPDQPVGPAWKGTVERLDKLDWQDVPALGW